MDRTLDHAHFLHFSLNTNMSQTNVLVTTSNVKVHIGESQYRVVVFFFIVRSIP